MAEYIEKQALLKKMHSSHSTPLLMGHMTDEDVMFKTMVSIVEEEPTANVVEVPCNVGDDVYIPWHYNGTRGIAYYEVTHIIIDGKKSYVKTNFETDDDGFWELFNGGKFNFDDFGKTIFLTKKEAEKALKEGAVDGC